MGKMKQLIFELFLDELEHDSSPNGCHEDCDACAQEAKKFSMHGFKKEHLAWVKSGRETDFITWLKNKGGAK